MNDVPSIQLARINEVLVKAKQAELYKNVLNDVLPISSLEEVHALPFTTKDQLRKMYPYGALALSNDEVIEAHTSSGTTGRPTVSFFTRTDLKHSSEYISRAWKNFGITNKSRVQFMMSYGLFSGAMLNTYAIQKLGAFVLPSGIQSTAKQVQLMMDFKIDTIVATPSYYLHLLDYLDANNINPKELNLVRGIVAGESYTTNLKARIAERFDIKLFDHYGLCEVNTGIVYECAVCGHMAVLSDYVYAEVIDPETGELTKPNELGELVFTTLLKDASPVIRYRTGDMSRLINNVSECKGCFGNTVISRIQGRKDDIIFYKGLKIDPYELRDLILLHSDNELVRQAKILVIKDVHDIAKQIVIQLSLRNGGSDNALAGVLEKVVKESTGVTVTIEFVDKESFQGFGNTKVKLVESIYESNSH